MSSRLGSGVYVPPKVAVQLAVGIWADPINATVLELSRSAGADIGTALVTYPTRYGTNASPGMGTEAKITIDGQVAFRGAVGLAPFAVSEGEDAMTLLLYDDKWLMQGRVVGQYGIGTLEGGDGGFEDVGFEVVFNAQGGPNKDPAARKFNTGKTAVPWTLKDVLWFLFEYYVPSGVARLTLSDLSSAYDAAPSDLDLQGQTALQAIDTVVELAGESWALNPRATYSQFAPVKAGTTKGKQRTIYLNAPKGGQGAAAATVWHASEISCDADVRNVHDCVQCLSAPIVKETTYTSDGEDPLLVVSTEFKDKEYKTRFVVDVTKYAKHNLGAALSAGSKPKPWLPELVTRRKRDGVVYKEFLTAAGMKEDANRTLADRVPQPYVWLGGSEATARLCTGGVRIDCDGGTIDIKPSVDLLPAAGAVETVAITNPAALKIWVTIATVLERRQMKQSEDGSAFLPVPMWQVITKSDLVPERREKVWLPDLASANNNAKTIAAEDAEELYVDVTDQLEAVVTAAGARAPEVETRLRITLPFFPVLDVGDLLRINGRSVGATGREVVTRIQYKVHESYNVYVDATNVAAGVGQMGTE